MPKPVADATGSDWDGIGESAIILKPEHFYQTDDVIYFVDGRSCARKYNRTTAEVTTIFGNY